MRLPGTLRPPHPPRTPRLVPTAFEHPEGARGEVDSKPPVEIDIPAPALITMPIAPLERWHAMGRFFVVGIGAGILLLGALAVTGEDAPRGTAAQPGSDGIVHLERSAFASTCFADVREGSAKLTVSARVDRQGRVAQAAVAGGGASLRRCVEIKVRNWSFGPQEEAGPRVLPIQVDPD